jgi:hypothetical protein
VETEPARRRDPRGAHVTDDALERLIAREWTSYASEQGLAPLGEFGFTDFAAGIRRGYQQAEAQTVAAIAGWLESFEGRGDRPAFGVQTAGWVHVAYAMTEIAAAIRRGDWKAGESA